MAYVATATSSLTPRLHQGAGPRPALIVILGFTFLCVYIITLHRGAGLQWNFPFASSCFSRRGALLVNSWLISCATSWAELSGFRFGPAFGSACVYTKLGPRASPRLPPELVRMQTRFWYRILIFIHLHQNLGRPNARCKRGPCLFGENSKCEDKESIPLDTLSRW